MTSRVLALSVWPCSRDSLPFWAVRGGEQRRAACFLWYGLMDSARHDIGFQLNEDTKVQNAFDDEASITSVPTSWRWRLRTASRCSIMPAAATAGTAAEALEVGSGWQMLSATSSYAFWTRVS